MTFFNLALKNLLRHKTRNALTLVGITTSVIVLYSIISFNEGFITNLNQELGKTGVHFMVVPAGCPHEVAALVLHGSVIPSYLDKNIGTSIARVAGDAIEISTAVLVFQQANENNNRLDLVYGMDFSTVENLKPWWRIQGKKPTGPNEILVGHEIAAHDKLNIGEGYQLQKTGKRYTIAGILEKTSTKDDAFVYFDLSEAQNLVGKTDSVTAVGIKLKDPAAMGPVMEKLSKEIPGIQIVTINQIITSISTLAAAARVLSLSVVAIAILISAIGVMNSILMTVFERTQEIGMMRAIGASKRNIFHLIIKESIIMTSLGGAAGIVIAIFFSRFIEDFVKGFMPYVPQGTIISFQPLLALSCFLFAVTLGVISGFYPAGKAARISPIEAIRS